jgi:TnpA family transposase
VKALGYAIEGQYERRIGGAKQLGFALQLCAFRHPGCVLRPGAAIPEAAVGFVVNQLRIGPSALSAYATRSLTRREQVVVFDGDGRQVGAVPRPARRPDGREIVTLLR